MISDTPTALKQFEEAATRHAEATEVGEYKRCNKCYVIITKAIAFLKDKNEMELLTKFLDHPSVGVRGWAATYLLPIRENDGVRVLEQIATGEGIHSLDAKTTLSELRKGRLHL